MSCPHCGDGSFVAKIDEESKCAKCGARFYVNDKPFNLLKCHRCQKNWIYKGGKTFPSYTSCPNCKSSVRV